MFFLSTGSWAEAGNVEKYALCILKSRCLIFTQGNINVRIEKND